MQTVTTKFNYTTKGHSNLLEGMEGEMLLEAIWKTEYKTNAKGIACKHFNVSVNITFHSGSTVTVICVCVDGHRKAG